MMKAEEHLPELRIEPAAEPLDKAVEGRLREELAACPDVAFAHLPQVSVAGHQPDPRLTLFVWLVPEAMSSLKAALNLVSGAVARALPHEMCLDILILNSAPEMLEAVEAAGCLLVERDSGERSRARAAAVGYDGSEPARPKTLGWWPF